MSHSDSLQGFGIGRKTKWPWVSCVVREAEKPGYKERTMKHKLATKDTLRGGRGRGRAKAPAN